jgi:hypothetical protein
VGYGQEILDGLWRFTAVHPEWEDGDDWEPVVAWWAVQTDRGLLLVDPLVDDWDELDGLVEHGGGCAGVARTCHWHQRSITEVSDRYAAAVWALPAPAGQPAPPVDLEIAPGRPLPGDLLPFEAVRDDEIVIWSPPHRVLLAGDVLVRDTDGALRLCPDSWIERAGGRAAIKPALADLLELDVRHVLVGHEPLVLGDGPDALADALTA